MEIGDKVNLIDDTRLDNTNPVTCGVLGENYSFDVSDKSDFNILVLLNFTATVITPQDKFYIK